MVIETLCSFTNMLILMLMCWSYFPFWCQRRITFKSSLYRLNFMPRLLRLPWLLDSFCWYGQRGGRELEVVLSEGGANEEPGRRVFPQENANRRRQWIFLRRTHSPSYVSFLWNLKFLGLVKKCKNFLNKRRVHLVINHLIITAQNTLIIFSLVYQSYFLTTIQGQRWSFWER